MAGRRTADQPLAAICHGEPPPVLTKDEEDTLNEVRAVAQALGELGWRVAEVPVGLDLDAVRRRLLEMGPRLVFNLVESIRGRGSFIHLAPTLYDSLGIPFTGVRTNGIFLTNDKLLAKRIMADHGLDTPPWATAPRALAGDLPFGPPWIVKNAHEHASIGVNAEGIARSRRELLAILKRRLPGEGASLFVEGYVDGRELNVAVLGREGSPEILPPSEIVFDDYPQGMWKIVDYKAKWVEDSFEYEHTNRSFDFPPADEVMIRRVREMAVACWRIFGLSGYARVDFRVDPSGRPTIMEVNANPCIDPDSGFSSTARRAGLDYRSLIARIVDEALLPAFAAGTPAPPARTPGLGGGRLRWRRKPTPADREAIGGMVAATGFFNPAEVEIALELVDDRLSQGDRSPYRFLLAERDGRLLGYVCYGPVAGTAGSFDLYWIVVSPGEQGRGIGRALMARAEGIMAAEGCRRVYVETSSRAQYLPTRSFYEACGYRPEALLAGFYGPGDGKLVYVKTLALPAG
jgi:D-alanine--D-alanine ligase